MQEFWVTKNIMVCYGIFWSGQFGAQPRSQGSLLPVPTERERERETLVGSGHVVPEQY